MRLWSLSFLTGVLLLQLFTYLPSTLWILLGPTMLFMSRCFLISFWQILRLPIACALGFSWVLWFAHHLSSWTIPQGLEGKTVTAVGYVASIPNLTEQGTTFIFALKKFNDRTAKGKVHLVWKNTHNKLFAGDAWELHIRLKKIHGMMNPGGFDYEAFAFQDGLRATGYVNDHENNRLLNHHWYHYPITQMREQILKKISDNIPPSNTSPWIIALLVGEKRNISAQNWEILRNTGTNHLMAIGGLHIGFVAALMHFIFARLWRYFPRLMFLIPAQHTGAIAALTIAIIYSAMAGFALPTQRACVMLAVFLIAFILNRNLLPWHAWCCALLGVLLINPLTVITESFWLSFGSVALIILSMSGRLAAEKKVWKWMRMQWVIALGLIPLSIGLFHQCSLVSFFANSIAIPCVGWIIVPCCLVGCFTLLFSAKLGGLLLTWADKLLNILWIILTEISNLPHVVWYQTITCSLLLMFSMIGIILILLPRGFPGRYLSVIWVLPIVLFKPPSLQLGEIKMILLDVGQGLSTIIQTQNHNLVFDTGPRFGINYDMGASVVVPFLHSIGIKKIDMLVISHGDNDHIGGSQALLNQFPTAAIRSSVPEKLSHAAYCLSGTSWRWDNVDFKFIYPTPDNLNLNNNSSCVLRISNNRQSILLTGDIEKFAEKKLAASVTSDLLSTVLIAPHHGSKTSANIDFLNAVKPLYVLFSTGYRNRYHFPHVSVIKKYRDMKVTMLDTAESGAIQLQLTQDNAVLQPQLYRQQHKHYWN